MGRSEWWKRTKEKHGFSVEICFNSSDHDECILLEMWLIAKFKHENFPLVNMTEGGEGRLGCRHSDEMKARASERLKGIAPSNNTRIAQIASVSQPVISSEGIVYSSAIEAARVLFPENIGAAKAGICSCIKGRTKSYKGIGFSFASEGNYKCAYVCKRRTKKVHSDKGEVFSSISQAARSVCPEYSRAAISNITQAAKGNVKTAYGRRWFYTEEN